MRPSPNQLRPADAGTLAVSLGRIRARRPRVQWLTGVTGEIVVERTRGPGSFDTELPGPLDRQDEASLAAGEFVA